MLLLPSKRESYSKLSMWPHWAIKLLGPCWMLLGIGKMCETIIQEHPHSHFYNYIDVVIGFGFFVMGLKFVTAMVPEQEKVSGRSHRKWIRFCVIAFFLGLVGFVFFLVQFAQGRLPIVLG